MTTFGFSTAGDIRFGRGVSRTAAEAVAGFSDRALLVHGRNPDRAAWLLDDLRRRGISVTALACPGEPDVALVEAAVTTARKVRPGVVIGLGGGSAIDLAKAVAALTPASAQVLAYLEVVGKGRALDAPPLPSIAIPTTAGTGAEVTRNAVIGVPEHRRKVSLRDARMIPDVAIVDPALTDGAPRGVTFASGLDAVTQVIEPYLSVKASPLTDALCADAVPRGLRALLRLAEAEDQGARDDIALTSLIGGMALANAGLGAVHGLAGVIGGRTGAPHGEICAALLPHVLALNAQSSGLSDSGRGRIARVLGWIADALGVDAQDATRALAESIAAFGIRGLSALGVGDGEIDAIAEASRGASSSRTNPVPPEDFDFGEALRRALRP